MVIIAEKIRPDWTVTVGTKQDIVRRIVERKELIFSCREIRHQRGEGTTKLKCYVNSEGDAIVFNLHKVRAKFKGPKGKRQRVRYGHWVAYIYTIPHNRLYQFRKIEQLDRNFKIDYR